MPGVIAVAVCGVCPLLKVGSAVVRAGVGVGVDAGAVVAAGAVVWRAVRAGSELGLKTPPLRSCFGRLTTPSTMRIGTGMSIRRRRHHGGDFASGRRAGVSTTAGAVLTMVGWATAAGAGGGVLGARSTGRTSAEGDRNGDVAGSASAAAGGSVGGCEGGVLGAIAAAAAGLAPIA